MTSETVFHDYLVEHFNGETFNLGDLDSLGWVNLITFLGTKDIVVDFALLPSVDSISSLYSISKNAPG